jgi:hypothetical protein
MTAITNLASDGASGGWRVAIDSKEDRRPTSPREEGDHMTAITNVASDGSSGGWRVAIDHKENRRPTSPRERRPTSPRGSSSGRPNDSSSRAPSTDPQDYGGGSSRKTTNKHTEGASGRERAAVQIPSDPSVTYNAPPGSPFGLRPVPVDQTSPRPSSFYRRDPPSEPSVVVIHRESPHYSSSSCRHSYESGSSDSSGRSTESSPNFYWVAFIASVMFTLVGKAALSRTERSPFLAIMIPVDMFLGCAAVFKSIFPSR